MTAPTTRRRRVCRVAAVFAAGILLTTGCAAPKAPGGRTNTSATSIIGPTLFPVGARKPLPAIAGTTLAGNRLDVRDVVGHGVVVINVWASWCTECRTESPALAQLARELAPAGSTFVGVDEEDTAVAGRAFAAQSTMSFPQLVDADRRILDLLTVLPNYGIPSTLVVDRNGLMAARIVGAASADQVRRLIDQVQSET